MVQLSFSLLLGIVLCELCLPANRKENQLNTLLISERLWKAETKFVLEMATF